MELYTKKDMLDFVEHYDNKKEKDCFDTFAEELSEFLDTRKNNNGKAAVINTTCKTCKYRSEYFREQYGHLIANCLQKGYEVHNEHTCERYQNKKI